MSDGRVVIDVTLDDRQVRSDARVIEDLLQRMGSNAGQNMDQNFARHTNNVIQFARRTSQSVNQEFRNPVEQRIEVRDEATSQARSISQRLQSETHPVTETIEVQDRATGEAQRVFRTVSSEADNAERHLSVFKGAFAGTFAANMTTSAIGMIKNGIAGLIHAGVEYNATQDRMMATWTTLTGSATKGKQMVDMVNNFQRETGYATETLNEMEQKIYHIKSSASETQEMTKAFTTLGDAMGLSNDRLLSVAEQFSQMMANGNAYAGDLNIMTNAFPAFGDALVHHMGIGMGQIRKQASLGKLSATEVEATLIEMSHKYASATANAMNTTQGLWRSMQSNWGRLAGDFAKPIFDLKKSGFKDLEDWLASSQADKYFTHLGQTVAQFVSNATDLVGYLNKNRDTVIGFGKAFVVLSAEIYAVKKIASVVGAFQTVMGGLTRLRGSMAETAVASESMAAAEIASTRRMEAAGAATARTGKSMIALHGALNIAGAGLMAFGGKWGMISGIAINFLPQILKAGSYLFTLGRTAIVSGAALRLLISPVGLIVAGVAALAGGFYLAYKYIRPFHDWVDQTGTAMKNSFVSGMKAIQNMSKPVLNSVISWGNGVNKATQTALNSYVKLSDTARKKLEDLVVTQTKISKSSVPTLVQPYRDMANQVIAHFNRMEKGAASALAGIRKTNKSEYEAILKETTANTSAKEKAVNSIEKQIESIYQNAAKNHRGITVAEQAQINSLQNKMNSYAVESMSNSAKEQTVILGKLKDHASVLSAEEAAAIVRNAKQQETETINSANNTYKKAVSAANAKYNGVKSWADQEYYVNKSISRQQYEDIVSNAQKERDGVIAHAKTQHDQVVSKARDMQAQTVKYAKQQAKGHVDQVNWETGQVLTGWDKMWNKVDQVWKWIEGLFGDCSSKQSSSSVKHHAHGTLGHPGGPAVVGDGTGSNAGPEAIITPDGNLSFSPSKPTLVDLPAGTTVLSATNTRRLFGNVPKYANGITSKMFDWLLQGPKYLITKAFDAAGLNNQMVSIGGTWSKWASNMVSKAASLAINWAKSKSSEWIGGLLAVPSHISGSLKTWIGEAMSIANIPASWASGLASIAMHESGGNPNAVNRWDINAKLGHPSMGLMQMIGSTFSANAMPGHNNILNPIDNIIASYNYIRKRYGNILNVPGIRSMAGGGGYVGYANGTDSSSGGHVVVGENEPEVIETKDGRIVVATKPTSFDDFMAGSKVTPLSKLPHYANGIIAKANNWISSISGPALAIPQAIVGSGGMQAGQQKETVIQLDMKPITVYSVLDGKVISKSITDAQNIENIRSSRLRGEINVRQ